jgi:hypothetical protein
MGLTAAPLRTDCHFATDTKDFVFWLLFPGVRMELFKTQHESVSLLDFILDDIW